jgi:hypothetical protein
MKFESSSVGFLVLLIAGQAFADPPRDPWDNPSAGVPAASRGSVSEKQRLALIEQGKRLTRDGQYPEALQVLREALEARPDPRVLLWMGYAQEQTGALLAARASYLQAKAVAHAGNLVGEERNADQALLDIGAKIPRIKLEIPPDVKAKIQIDGKEVPLSSDGVEVDPGVHSVFASGPGLQSYRVSVAVKLGAVKVVEAVLTRIVPGPPDLPPPPDKTGGAPSGRVDAIVIAGIATTAVGVAMGAGFAIASEVKRQERDEQIVATLGCRNLACEPYNAPERARGGFLTASLVSFLAAGAIGAGTLTYSLVTRTKKSTGATSATVSAGLGGIAGAMRITW